MQSKNRIALVPVRKRAAIQIFMTRARRLTFESIPIWANKYSTLEGMMSLPEPRLYEGTSTT